MVDNSSTGNMALDNGLDSIFGNSQQTPVQNTTSGISQNQLINLQQLIGGLLQAGGQGLNAAGNFVNPQQNQPSASQQIQQNVATKVYTKSLQAHADNTPTQILASLIDQWNPNASGNSQTTNAQTPNPQQVDTSDQKTSSQSPSIDDQISQINKQATLNVANKNLQTSQSPKGLLDQFGQNVRDLSGITAARNTSNEAVQKIAGGEPLQPKDVSEMTAGVYKAGLEATHQAAATSAAALAPLVDLLGKQESSKGLVAKYTNKFSPEQEKTVQAIEAHADNLSIQLKNLRTLASNTPKFNSQGVSQTAQATTNKINQGKVGKYTLVQSK